MRLATTTLATFSLLLVNQVARADSVIDEILTTPALMQTVNTLGHLALEGRKDAAEIERDRVEVRDHAYWAFSPDVTLAPGDRDAEERKFAQMWDTLVATSRLYDVRQVSFMGCDTIATVRCMTLDYLALTPRGPVAFSFAMEFGVGDHPRLMNVATTPRWDDIGPLIRNIQHTVDPTKVPTMTWTPKATTTQPAAVSPPQI